LFFLQLNPRRLLLRVNHVRDELARLQAAYAAVQTDHQVKHRVVRRAHTPR
jgi:hypothetical protein